MRGKYDILGLKIIVLLKTNFSYLYHIRKIRNIIKANPSAIKFRLATDHIEAYFTIQFSPQEKIYLPFLNINNIEKTKGRGAYNATINLDAYFPEMLVFFKQAERVLKEDLNRAARVSPEA